MKKFASQITEKNEKALKRLTKKSGITITFILNKALDLFFTNQKAGNHEGLKS